MTYSTINPATGETVRTFEDISDADLDNALDTARSCYQDDWRHRPVTDRARIMKAAAAELRANAAEYAQVVTVEMGKLIGTSEAEVGLSAAILDYYAHRAETFLAPKELPESPGAVIETEPIGVILGIEPWNFPYYQLARVAGPQLMAGNVLVIKHAENVPQCALAFARLFETAGAPAGVYTNVFASIDKIETRHLPHNQKDAINADACCFLNSLGQAHRKLALLFLGSSDTDIAGDDRHGILLY